MNNVPDSFIFYEDLSAEERQALRRRLAEDPALAAAFRRWRALRAALRRRLDTHVPERRLLVLHALQGEEEAANVLTPAEREHLTEAREALREAFEAHPALADVVRQIQQERRDFEAAWAEHVPAGAEVSAPGPARRPERAAQARAAYPKPGRRWVWRLSVGVALVVFAVVALLLLRREQHLVTVEAQRAVRLVELADGSTVRLLRGARLTYVDPDAEAVLSRQARLEGRAFFDIAPAQEGFIVETPTARATVLGTRFGMQADETATEVVLASGTLALAPKEAQDRVVVLNPGQMSRVARNALPTTPVEVDLTEALGWSGLLVFQNAPLETIAERLSRHYGMKVSVAPSLREEALTGTFDQEQPLEEVLGVLAQALGAEVRRTEGYIITPVSR